MGNKESNVHHNPQDIINQKEKFIQELEKNPLLLEHAPKELQNDLSVVSIAVINNGEVLKFASAELQDNKELVLKALDYKSLYSKPILSFASKRLQSDKDVVEKALLKDIQNIRFVSSDLFKDKEFFLKLVVDSQECIYSYLDESLRNDREITWKVLEKGRDITIHIGKDLLIDRIFVLKALEINSNIYRDLPEIIREDFEISKKAILMNDSLFLYTPQKLRKQKDFALFVVGVHKTALKYLPEEFKEDKDVVLKSVQLFGGSLCYSSLSLKSDKDILLAAVSSFFNVLSENYYDKSLLNDKEFVLKLIEINPKSIMYTNQFRDDKDVIMKAVEKDGMMLSCASEQLKKDPDIVGKASQQNGCSLMFASIDLKKNREILLKAEKSSKESWKYITEELNFYE